MVARIPSNRLLDCRFEGGPRLPSERAKLRRVNCIAVVMLWPVVSREIDTMFANASVSGNSSRHV